MIKRATSKQLLTGVFIYIQAWYLIGPSITIDSGIYPTELVQNTNFITGN